MKRFLLILTLCGSVQADDRRLAEALEQAEFKLRQLESQIARIEKQHEPVEKDDDGLTPYQRDREALGLVSVPLRRRCVPMQPGYTANEALSRNSKARLGLGGQRLG